MVHSFAPIFDDAFEHCDRNLTNNSFNICFQSFNRRWFIHIDFFFYVVQKKKVQRCDSQGQNWKLIAHQNDVPLSPLLRALCGKWHRHVGTKYRGDHVLQFKVPKSMLPWRVRR
uniref:Uncharacterized protein n=1 Tax=Lepeophtheirus salmonis TaxID=72036 RepID=A0A0K2U0T0_LEPSM